MTAKMGSLDVASRLGAVPPEQERCVEGERVSRKWAAKERQERERKRGFRPDPDEAVKRKAISHECCS